MTEQKNELIAQKSNKLLTKCVLKELVWTSLPWQLRLKIPNFIKSQLYLQTIFTVRI